jgi:hypothetical protein
MSSHTRVDNAIVAVLEKAGEPSTLKALVHRLENAGLNEGRSNRVVADRIYELRREGRIEQVGIGKDTRYAPLGYTKQAETERTRQLAEARRRTEEEIVARGLAAPESVPPAPAIEPEQLGPCDLLDLGDRYVAVPRTTEEAPPNGKQKEWIGIVEQQAKRDEIAPAPASVVVVAPESAQPFEARVATIAQHIGTSVTLTVQQLIAEALAGQAATLKMQTQESDKLGTLNDQLVADNDAKQATIDQLQKDMREQEALYNDLDAKYNSLRQKLAALADD